MAPVAEGGRQVASLRRAVRPLALAAALGAAVWAYGVWRLHTIALQPFARVGIVQPDIPEDEKMQEAMRNRFIEPLAALTASKRPAAHRSSSSGRKRRFPTFSSMIPAGPTRSARWPAPAIRRSLWPDRLYDHRAWAVGLRVLQRGDGGRHERSDRRPTVVSQGLSGPDRRAGTVPQSTMVHRQKHFQALLRYFGGFGRGTSATPFTFAFGKVGVLICYESIFPQQSRALGAPGQISS